jgi:ABC-2 type transport system permease protein
MPPWLRALSSFNPLTYEVDGLRAAMLRGSVSLYGIAQDFAALLLASVVFIVIATRLYPRMTE